MTCPFCESPNVQSHAAIYDAGTMRANVTHYGSGGHPHPTYGTATHQTKLAARCAPPSPGMATPFPLMIAFAIGAWFLSMGWNEVGVMRTSGILIGLVAVGIGYLLTKFWRHQLRAYARAKREWLNTWYCQACGQSHIRQ